MIIIFEKYLDVCKSAAQIAGQKIMEIYNTDFDDSIELKVDDSPITAADKAANDIIVNMLCENFPEVSMLSEESKLDESRFKNDLCFVVDPLDGTKEFIKRNGEFTVNIALAYKHKSVLGVIYVPVTGLLYYAAQDYGAYREENGEVTKLSVTDKRDNLILVGSKSHASDKLKALIEAKRNLIKDVVSAGSSLKGTMIAEGKADIYYRYALCSEWDTAAMQCIVEEAGGIFKQIDGTEMTYNRINSLNEKGFYAINSKDNLWV